MLSLNTDVTDTYMSVNISQSHSFALLALMGLQYIALYNAIIIIVHATVYSIASNIVLHRKNT